MAHVCAFGIGRRNPEPVQHELFDDDPAWDLPEAAQHRDMACRQLGTIGSGNDDVGAVRRRSATPAWVGVHFGSRGLDHKLASHFIRTGGGRDGIHVDPVLLATGSDLGQRYLNMDATRRPLRLRRPRLGVRPRRPPARRHGPGRGAQPPQLRLARAPLRPRPEDGAQRRHPGVRPISAASSAAPWATSRVIVGWRRQRTEPPHPALHRARRRPGHVAAPCGRQVPPTGAAAWNRSARARSAAT